MVAQTVSPLVVIVGETGSGKSALAIELAQEFNGEIICADSRTVYKEMNLGTAKPTLEDQQVVPHHLLDIATPDQQVTAATFKKLAVRAISEISARGKLPILVGGTGLYIDAVVFDFQFLPAADTELRNQLSELSVEALQSKLLSDGIALPNNARNKRHLIRAIETKGVSAGNSGLRENTLILGLRLDQEALKVRLKARVNTMVEQGLIQEVKQLGEHYGWSIPALQTPGYKAFRDYVLGKVSLNEAKERFLKNDLQLAKRQRTWFRRNKSIHWLHARSEAVEIITAFLNK